MANFIEAIFHLEKRELKKIAKEADRVIALEETMAALTDDQLREKTEEFKKYLAEATNDEDKDRRTEDIKIEAFAVAREAAWRSLKQKPFKVQIIGSLVLNGGNIAEMRTGEGKTLTATMAVYLNALRGEGVHVITVNEYLASRDAEWMGQVYRFLGLTVGVNLASKTTSEKREAYLCDITYTTNSELGFDYLRDNMATSMEGRVLRGLKFCIVDEADSVLIDESRTPLIISGGKKSSASQYQVADRFVKMLRKEKDFTVDIKTKTASLTDDGNDKAEKMFGVRNLYDPENQDLVHRIHQALKANYIMSRDVEYMVDAEHQIQLIDQFTGRVMKGREYNDGLQQAIQAKEGVEIKQETVVMATITYQNFFRLYKKLSGMTGTAKTEEEEFEKIYNMKVIVIPTNRPIQRIDDNDYIYGNHDAKLAGLVEEVKARHEKGQPVLIGTSSVESNEEVSALLTKAGIPHEVLNAKNQAREAEIISHAGERGAVTLATNMAGRGTDIKLGEGVKELGGLCVLGTERHESRRIDNQLRGRSGRQGDPGYSRFYVSFDDELMRRFVADNIREMFKKQLGDEHLENRMVQNVVTNAQKQIEGRNFDTRKNLLDFDDVLAKQRQIIYNRRDNIMLSGDITEMVHGFFIETGKSLAKKAVMQGRDEGLVNAEELRRLVEPSFVEEGTFPYKSYEEAPVEEAGEDLGEFLYLRYLERRKQWTPEQADYIERNVSLSVIDRNWTKHIDTMSHLRDGISLRSYAHTNPLQDYVNEGYALFREMNENVSVDCAYNFMRVRLSNRDEQQQPANPVQGETAQAEASGNVQEAQTAQANPHGELAPAKEEDLLVANHRKSVQQLRDGVLHMPSVARFVRTLFDQAGLAIAGRCVENGEVKAEQIQALIDKNFVEPGSIDVSDLEHLSAQDASVKLGDALYQQYLVRRKKWTPEQADFVERTVCNQVILKDWEMHLANLEKYKAEFAKRPDHNSSEDYLKGGEPLLNLIFEAIAGDCVINLLHAEIQLRDPQNAENK
ncbi:MAG: preprotein translocase subunit SecA [Erysipelotrichaceae bacterium]|nr:preprotein translocase subunit SecA [Erysipelotrichaceae bacterium]